jgi:RNA polymerase sigma-70 factor (sigma-E family)
MSASFDTFLDEQLVSLVRFAGVLTGDRHLAEDVVQEVLGRAFKQWGRIGAFDQPATYVRRMVVNEHISWRRKWSRMVPRAQIHSRAVHDDHAVIHAERDALAQRLDRLPARQRAVIVLRYYEGLSDQEIADVLGCGAGTVRSHASRALARLRIDLAESNPQPSRRLERNADAYR